MAVERTGTAQAIDGTAQNSSASITVPADAELVVVLWGGLQDYEGAISLDTLTINSNDLDIHLNTGSDFPDYGGGVATYVVGEDTGSQTLAWDWTGTSTIDEFGGFFVVYLKGCDLTGTRVRDSDFNFDAGTSNYAVTLTTTDTDMVLALGTCYTGTSPSLNGTSIFDNQTITNQDCDVTEITAGSSSTTATVTNGYYGSVTAVAIKEAGGGTALPLIMAYHR